MDQHQGFAIGPLTIIEVTGADRNKILNNLCTQDLRQLQSGQVRETFILDVKGRTISHGIVVGLDSKTLFISTPGQASGLMTHIDRYIIREDAVVRDASSDYQAVLFRPTAWSYFENSCQDLKQLECVQQGDDALESLILVAVPWLGTKSVLLLFPSQAQKTATSKLGLTVQASDCDKRSPWELERIKNFWPWYGVDINEKNLPQEIGIDSRAISFKKGCYLGQETVARLDALGQVQKQMVLVELRTPSLWGGELPYELTYKGKPIGILTSACKTESQASSEVIWMGLAMLKRGYLESPVALQLDTGELLKTCT
jgi:folate-binding protein YgfZ